MSESLLVTYSLLILFLPLLGFIVTLLLGKENSEDFYFREPGDAHLTCFIGNTTVR